ncbi:hypothetical protein TorRG33x02_098760 [Trema orientale]|uniref:Uncharacterized protein n=1 Tax=Trema orientale TaxID=63057 RepID=A0A2P5F9D7_TREOI|nr:hypothetical protein TorRG33x02_098760 [Trema orientale]
MRNKLLEPKVALEWDDDVVFVDAEHFDQVYSQHLERGQESNGGQAENEQVSLAEEAEMSIMLQEEKMNKLRIIMILKMKITYNQLRIISKIRVMRHLIFLGSVTLVEFYRVREKTMAVIQEDIKDQYALLWDYVRTFRGVVQEAQLSYIVKNKRSFGGYIVVLRLRSLNLVHYVDECYSKTAYEKSCGPLIKGSNGLELWPNHRSHPLDPPEVKKRPGMPKKMRRKEADKQPTATKVSKVGVIVHYKK